jgi:hypothetical protein
MKTQHALRGIALAASLLTASCSPIYYIPNSQNVPMLHTVGEANFTLAGNASQAEVQAAYAPVEHLGLMLNGALYVPQDADNGDGGRGKLGELGVGYYAPIGTHFVFESYGLLGAGTVDNDRPSSVVDYPNTTGKMHVNVLRFGLQPSIALRTKYFQAAISSRLMSLNYSGLRGDLNYFGQDQATYLAANRSSMLLEPAITIRGGLDHVKLQLQYLQSFNFTHADFRQQRSLLSVGINLDLD